MAADPSEPAEYLPLSEVVFEILLALAECDRHGYAILQAVNERTGGGLELHPGTLYRALNRLLRSELIEELSDPPEDARRRTYRLTPLGRHVAALEASRLSSQVRAARTVDLLPEPA